MNSARPTLVLCHDAGGAEIISAYVRAHGGAGDFFCYVAGPAEKIFARKDISAVRVSASDWNPNEPFVAHPDAREILLGIGWSSTIELDALRAARRRGVKTIVYLDHWVHYRERFGYPHAGWDKNLPNEFWVGDAYAERLAHEAFPNIPVILVPNQYFEEIKQEYQKRRGDRREEETDILFMSEPISAAINTAGDTDAMPRTEYDILDDVLSCVAERKKQSRVVVRLHPSEPREKYHDIILRYAGKLDVRVSMSDSIYDDLASAHLVIGMASMALVVAVLAGKMVVSFFPIGVPYPLPFREIEKVADRGAFGSVLDRLS